MENKINAKKVRVITYNKKKFVVGLSWRGLINGPRKFMKQAKDIGKREGLDVVAIRKSTNIQAGFAPKKSQALKGMYSLAVTLISLIEGNWIGIFPLPKENPQDQDEFVVIATANSGTVIPWTDVIVTRDEVATLIVDLLDSGTEFNVCGDISFPWVTDELILEQILLPSVLKKEFKLRPLTFGLTRKEILFYGVVVLLCLVGYFIYLDYLNKIEEKKEEVRRKERERIQEINKKAKYEAQLQSLKHPWLEQPSVDDFISNCNESLKNLDLSMKGWVPLKADCLAAKMEALYIRNDSSGATVEDFQQAVIERFNVVPSFNMKESGVSSFSFPLVMKSNGDDPVLPLSSQINKVISLLQRNNITASLAFGKERVEEKDPDGNVLPMPDWKQVYFYYSSDIPSYMIFKKTDMVGVRITSIRFEVNNSDGSLKYYVEGVIYGGA